MVRFPLSLSFPFSFFFFSLQFFFGIGARNFGEIFFPPLLLFFLWSEAQPSSFLFSSFSYFFSVPKVRGLSFFFLSSPRYIRTRKLFIFFFSPRRFGALFFCGQMESPRFPLFFFLEQVEVQILGVFPPFSFPPFFFSFSC